MRVCSDPTHGISTISLTASAMCVCNKARSPNPLPLSTLKGAR